MSNPIPSTSGSGGVKRPFPVSWGVDPDYAFGEHQEEKRPRQNDEQAMIDGKVISQSGLALKL